MISVFDRLASDDVAGAIVDIGFSLERQSVVDGERTSEQVAGGAIARNVPRIALRVFLVGKYCVYYRRPAHRQVLHDFYS